MRINVNRDTRDTLLRLFQIVLIVYIFTDLKNSRIVGNSQANRFSVYVAIALLLVLCGGYVLPSILRQQTKVEFSLFLVLLWIFIGNCLNADFSWTSIVHIGLAALWFSLYSFIYRYPQVRLNAHQIIGKFLRILVYVYILASAYASYVFRQVIQSSTGVLSTSYHVLVFLPIVLSSENKQYRNITTAATIITVILSFKRGSIIAMIAMLMTYIIMKGIQKKDASTIIKLIGAFVVLAFAIWQLDKVVGGRILVRFTRENLLDGSGRANMYSRAIAIFKSEPFLYKIIGMGGSTAIRKLGIAAHNEWLEFALDYGLIGCALYLNFVIQIYKIVIQKMRMCDKSACLLMCYVVYFLIVSMYGSIYFAQSTVFLFISLGFFSVKDMGGDKDI